MFPWPHPRQPYAVVWREGSCLRLRDAAATSRPSATRKGESFKGPMHIHHWQNINPGIRHLESSHVTIFLFKSCQLFCSFLFFEREAAAIYCSLKPS